ncbi:lysozyme-like protein [Daedaleopsis nitida]|nr:lysozyme-like protein [Daedaleopsis nitida]
MKLSAPFVLILAAFGAAEASIRHGARHGAHHNELAARQEPVHRRGTTSGRCKARTTSTTSTSHKATSTKKADPKPSKLTTTSTKSDNSGSDKAVGFASGLIRISDSSCGGPRASTKITGTDGPNGSIDWFNCGVESGGWKPPMVSVNDIVATDLDDALKDPNSPFQACKSYISTFKKYADQHGIPPIIIASVAMQESSCDPSTVGGGGEQGLMQITKDKCGGAPGGNCRDPDFNIKTGTAYFASVLNDNGGSLLKTIGNYNGWSTGMTIASATAAKHSDCCLCQNNLDYLQQMMNGWFQNKSPYAAHMGKYFNLDDCPGK